MKYSLSPETFFVKEIFNPQLSTEGKYFYYLLEKKGVSHKGLKKFIPGNAYFAGVKDRNASVQQWFCSPELLEEFEEKNISIKFKGCSDTRIHIGSHKGNQFAVKVSLNEEEQKAIRQFNPKKELLCNYFGEQRFDARAERFAKLIAEKRFEEALKFFLCEESKFDSEKSSAIKKVISSNWGNWKKIAEHDAIKETKKRELFDFLAGNQKSFEEAFDFAEPKSLKQMLKAAQSLRFNAALNLLARQKNPKNFCAEIAGQELAMRASKAFTRRLKTEATDFEKKHGCSAFERKTFFAAQKFKGNKIIGAKGENNFEFKFELGRGEYATVFLKFLEGWLKEKTK